MRKLLFLTVFLLQSSICYSLSECDFIDANGHIIGVNYTSIVVGGKSYDIPIANKEYEKDIYYLKKALNGDKEALEVFLQGQDKRLFYIGSATSLWLKATKDGKFEVAEYFK